MFANVELCVKLKNDYCESKIFGIYWTTQDIIEKILDLADYMKGIGKMNNQIWLLIDCNKLLVDGDRRKYN